MPDHGREDGPVGHSDSPRQDTQRPDHGDHADAGGQESTNTRGARSQLQPGTTPEGVEPPSGTLHADAPVPTEGRQPERPGQAGVLQARPGRREPGTMDPQAVGEKGDAGGNRRP